MVPNFRVEVRFLQEEGRVMNYVRKDKEASLVIVPPARPAKRVRRTNGIFHVVVTRHFGLLFVKDAMVVRVVKPTTDTLLRRHFIITWNEVGDHRRDGTQVGDHHGRERNATLTKTHGTRHLPIMLQRQASGVRDARDTCRRAIVMEDVPTITTRHPMVTRHPAYRHVVCELLRHSKGTISARLRYGRLSEDHVHVSHVETSAHAKRARRDQVLPFFLKGARGAMGASSPDFYLRTSLVCVVHFHATFKGRHRGKVRQDLTHLFRNLNPVVPGVNEGFHRELRLLKDVNQYDRPFVDPTIRVHLSLTARRTYDLRHTLRLRNAVFRRRIFLCFDEVRLKTRFVIGLSVKRRILYLRRPSNGHALLVRAVRPVTVIE